jgi:septum formation protein
MKPILLASSSPRRRDLLQQIGATFEVVPAHIDERCHPHEPAKDFVQRMAREKAREIWDNRDPAKRRCVLAADTVVVIDDLILGKPANQADALRMLRLLSGRTHQVLSAVALYDGT